jgi:hypothetical protein
VLSDKSHEKGPRIHQFVQLTLDSDEGARAGEYRGRVTHVSLSEVTLSILTKSGPFTATVPHDWLKPSDVSSEWTARARIAPVDPQA